MANDDAIAVAGLLIVAGGAFLLSRVQRTETGFTVQPAARLDLSPTFDFTTAPTAPDPVAPAVPAAPSFSFFDPVAPLSGEPPRTVEELRNRSTNEIVARTLWGEARGEGRRGMAAVAHVIANRASAGTRFGGPSLAGVALAPFQFSVWNSDDANRRAALAVTEADPHYRAALDLFDRVVIGGDLSEVPANARGADHYHATSIPPPGFTRSMRNLGDVGNHRFYSSTGVA